MKLKSYTVRFGDHVRVWRVDFGRYTLEIVRPYRRPSTRRVYQLKGDGLAWSGNTMEDIRRILRSR